MSLLHVFCESCIRCELALSYFTTLQVSFLESTLVAMEHEIADLRSRVMGGGANGHNGYGNGSNGNNGGERVMTRSSWR